MKKLIVLIAFFTSATLLVSCGETNAKSKVNKSNLETAAKRDVEISEGAPTISFDKSVYDFGTVKEGDIVETAFKVTNTGKTDLVITNAQGSCGCTVPVWPKKPIKPGQSADVQVKFNTSGKPNKQAKTVTLYTNTAVGREVLKLTGMVTPSGKKLNVNNKIDANHIQKLDSKKNN
ncbi:uncharacterized protein DUF1573 [Lutibacter sp. Hel_I_33_5]|uniref:DUF1573 domain-containing protein n=1 Tax=Lutibacter sp. Hel_I_33_5 TaxID=1566289 RepID=UPI0011A53A12|nr:DUF1573 domain-containing protein [Lutibacter sp. Hel_I_33_5]TVZ55456.1 uncharacterized protein DUF1573 [Lutibacter sp. Hel_I_33_5]